MSTKAAWKRLREAALAYPGAHEDTPWGHPVIKVNGKSFVFMSNADDEAVSLSVKLPDTHEAALILPFASPTGYGLGKSGWVSASFTAGDEPPVPLLLEWIDESYRAVAPKKLVKTLPPIGETESAPVSKKPVAKKPVAKKPVAKKPVSKKR